VSLQRRKEDLHELPPERLMRRSIVITGASKGIGSATAEALAAAGWQVIGIARHAPFECVNFVEF
jgi:nucleoside-diphosphate-sugar epimerase